MKNDWGKFMLQEATYPQSTGWLKFFYQIFSLFAIVYELISIVALSCIILSYYGLIDNKAIALTVALNIINLFLIILTVSIRRSAAKLKPSTYLKTILFFAFSAVPTLVTWIQLSSDFYLVISRTILSIAIWALWAVSNTIYFTKRLRFFIPKPPKEDIFSPTASVRKDEMIFLMNTWDGKPVRVPESKLEIFRAEQERQKQLAEQGKRLEVPEDFTQKMLELMDEKKQSSSQMLESTYTGSFKKPPEEKDLGTFSDAKEVAREMFEQSSLNSTEKPAVATKKPLSRTALVIILSVLAAVLLVIVCAIIYTVAYNKGFNDNQPIASDNTPIVYITKSGSKYHKKTCDYLSSSRIEISTKQAKEKGYTACSSCKPSSTSASSQKTTTQPRATAAKSTGSATATAKPTKAAVETCSAAGCDSSRQSDASYCSEHLCKWPNCSSRRKSDGYYCTGHECREALCHEVVATRSGNYCKNHTCVLASCPIKKTSGSNYCYYHKNSY